MNGLVTVRSSSGDAVGGSQIFPMADRDVPEVVISREDIFSTR